MKNKRVVQCCFQHKVYMRGERMDDLKVSFRLGSIRFSDISQVNESNREKLKQVFVPWEKKMLQTSAVHSLNMELNVDSTKIISVTVQSKIES